MGDDCDEGGEAPCMAHLLDEDGRLDLWTGGVDAILSRSGSSGAPPT